MFVRLRLQSSLAVECGALPADQAVATMRGRKPVPTTLRILRGNPHDHALNRDEPQPESLDEACPEELTDPVAQAEWERGIVPNIATGQITAADRPLAIAHCTLWAAWRSQLREASPHPNIIAAGKNKYPMPNPALTLAGKTLQSLIKVDAELGLTPTSRSRVKVKNKAPRSVDTARSKFFGTSSG